MTSKEKRIVILILGAMTALGPFSIDLYLPAFPVIAEAMGTTVARISLSLSSYFVGISIGQLFYGPLLDRFGRKPPLYFGLCLYILTSIGCLFATSADQLIALRLIQALGGCAAGVASMTMVRDLFETHESAKVLSLLILILGVSPLLAPTIGGFLSVTFGWKSIFFLLILMSTALLITVRFFLVNSREPDTNVSLRLGPIFRTFWSILKNPAFYSYALAAAVAFSGLFVYLAGSPFIFMETYKLSGPAYGSVFAFIAAGFIIASQLNVVVLKKYSNEQILLAGLIGQSVVGIVFFVTTYLDLLGLPGTVFMFFLFLCCFGFTNPNAAALSLRPFPHMAGSASALMGFLQMTMGATFSMSVGLLDVNSPLPVVAILVCTSTLGLLILLIGLHRMRTRA